MRSAMLNPCFLHRRDICRECQVEIKDQIAFGQYRYPDGNCTARLGALMGFNVVAIETIKDCLGVDRTEETVQALLSASSSRIEAIRGAIGGYRDMPVPPRTEGELRPFVGEGALWPWGSEHAPNDLKRVHLAAEDAIVSLQHELIYAHSIATADPVTTFLRIEDSPVSQFRTDLVAYATIMSYVYPLIEAGCIQFCRPEWDYDECPKAPPSCNFEELGVQDREWLARHGPTAAAAQDRVSYLVHELWRARKLYGRVDVRLLEARDRELIQWIYGSRPGNAMPTHRLIQPDLVADDEMFVGRSVADLQIPGFASLTTREIVSIRNGDEFERWRHALRAGVANSASIPSLLNPTQATLRQVKREVNHEAALLRHSFGRSAFLSERASGVREMVVQGVVGAATGSTISALAISALNSIGKVAASAAGNRNSSSQDAFIRHVQALNDR
ncbi:hypothetical protein ACFHW0_11120 [Micromonospora sp. LOL_025]|uniref:hypothetical protein n=1 Tax=Micromonospora sp. LOL_025 TaxID=3345413 RepID=UPI003A86E3DB